MAEWQPRYVRFRASPRYGQIVFRVRRRMYALKAPWCVAVFSERYGYDTVLPLGFGWRITVRDLPYPPTTKGEGE